MTTIDDLPVLQALDDPTFGENFKWSKELFDRGHRGLMRASWGEPVAVCYKDVLALSVNSLVGHQNIETQLEALPRPVARRDGALAKMLGAGTFHLQPPQLTANKQLITRGLTPKTVASFTDEFGSTVQRLVERSRRIGEIDFIRDFAKPALVAFWGTNLGLSSDEVEEAIHLATDLMAAFSLSATEDEMQLAYRAADGWMSTMPRLLERAERTGSYAIVNGLSAAYEAIDERQRQADRYMLLSQGLFDGFHTLGSGFAATVYGMIEGGFQPIEHCGAPGVFAKGLVSEAFRIHGAVAMTTRQALGDFEYDGLLVPAGTNIHMIWTLANLDPEVFASPFNYVLDRSNASRKLSFGGGPYMCAGRHLAVALSERLVTEFVGKRVQAHSAGSCKWRAGSTIHELTEFPIILT